MGRPPGRGTGTARSPSMRKRPFSAASQSVPPRSRRMVFTRRGAPAPSAARRVTSPPRMRRTPASKVPTQTPPSRSARSEVTLAVGSPTRS
jgi:hypothetical protein